MRPILDQLRAHARDVAAYQRHDRRALGLTPSPAPAQDDAPAPRPTSGQRRRRVHTGLRVVVRAAQGRVA